MYSMAKVHWCADYEADTGYSEDLYMKLSTAFALCFALILTWDTNAHAYLDSNSGSIIIQALIGGVVGMGVLRKMYWHTLLIKLGIKKPIIEDDDE